MELLQTLPHGPPLTTHTYSDMHILPPIPPHQHHLFLYGSIAASTAYADKYHLRNWSIVKATIHRVHLLVSTADKIDQGVKSAQH